MENKKRDRLDRLQNLLIVLLSLSAMVLFVITQSASLGLRWNPDQFAALSDSAAAAPGESATLADLAAPIHVAVGSGGSRFGAGYTTTDNTALSHLYTLMGSALGSAEERTGCSESAFRAALARDSIYFDFTAPLPLPVLADLLGTELLDEESHDTGFSARMLVLSPDNHGVVRLYLRDGGGTCYVSTPVLYTSDLESVSERFEPNGAAFAFESGPAYAALDPYTLVTEQTPVCPELSAAGALTDKDTLLRQLGFNPHTPSRYPDADGTDILLENTRTVRMRTDGTVLYTSDGDPTLSVSAAGQLPTLVEAATGTRQLAERLLSEHTGEAQLYLEQISRTEETTVVRFGLRQEGLVIRYADGSAAAEFTLTGTIVTAFSIHFRQYAATDRVSPLLPLRQVAAVAAEGTRLTAAYVDDGGVSVSASWLSN